MISRFVNYKLMDSSKGTVKVYESIDGKALLFDYPCTSSSDCTPYKLTLSKGTYLFECWGANGASNGQKGRGAYASGILSLTSEQNVYVYIGATGLFNGGRRAIIACPPGGATDVRLVYNINWYDTSSLISRIIVAGGGGGTEWVCSIGGNGGAPNGTQSYVSRSTYSSDGYYPTPLIGATNTRGGYCTTSYYLGGANRQCFEGKFGVAGNSDSSNDLGGIGGGGYYGGATMDYAGGGSGGSSFVSGHPSCNAVKESLTITHTGEPYHYSGLIFKDPNMTEGGKLMHLPNGFIGIRDDLNGVFKLTLVDNVSRTMYCKQSNYFSYVLISIISQY
jgi:hypothetical protein